MSLKSVLAGLLLSTTALVTTLPAQATAEQAVLADLRLPPEVFFHLSVPNVTELRERFADSNMGRLWNDSSMADFRAELMEKYEEASEELEDELGASITDLLEIPSGEVCIAIASPSANKLGLIVFVDFAGAEDTVDDLLEQAEEALEEQDVDRSTREFDDTEIFVFEREGGGNGIGRRLAYFIKDSTFVISTEITLLESALSRWDGESQRNFSANETYGYIMDRCRVDDRTPLMSIFINPVDLATKVIQSGLAGQGNMAASMALGFLPALGLDRIKAFGMASDMGSDDFDSITRSYIYAEQPPGGIVRAFMLEDKEHTPPSWVPDNASAFYSAKWKIEEAYEAIGGVVDMFAGGPGTFKQLVDQFAESERGPGIHPKTDLVDQLTGQFTAMSDSGDSEAEAAGRFLMALECKDNGAMEDVLEKLADMPGFPAEVREFREYQIFEMPNPQGTGGRFGLTVGSQGLMFATDVTLLEKVLRGETGDRLADSPDYREIAQHFPPTAAMISYQTSAGQVKVFYEKFRLGEAGDIIPGADEVNDAFDFSTLPPFEEVAKYFTSSGGYTKGDKNGAFSENFSLTAE